MKNEYQERLSLFNQDELGLNFKLRAEGKCDTDAFVELLRDKYKNCEKDKGLNQVEFIKKYETSLSLSYSLLYPEVQLEIYNSGFSYNELLLIMKKVPDGHVMVESLNIMKFYTGERMGEGFYE